MTLEEKLSRLEARQRIAISLIGIVTVGLALVATVEAYQIHRLQTADVLRVKALHVYDDKGVDRVILAGRLPQVLVNGKPHFKTRRDMAGMLIYDATGTERGGYGTMDGYANALITLDTQQHQVFLALAEPQSGPFIRQWNGDGSLTMGVSDQKPFLTLRDGKDVIFAAPKDNPWTRRGQR